MSIRPVKFNPDGSVEVVHDEANHGGTIPAEGIQFGRDPRGAEDFRFIVLACPVEGCGAVSIHPIGGGADPENVQRLFVRRLLRSATHPSKTLEEARLAAKAMAEQMDGPGHWKIDGAALEREFADLVPLPPTGEVA